MYAAGGHTKIVSYRNIELVRGGKLIAKFDLYDYLLKGDLSQNKVLQGEDVKRVTPYTNRVEMSGAVKRNAIYELSSIDRLSDMLVYAGGLDDNANKKFIRIARFGQQEKEIFTVKSTEAKTFTISTGDKIYVDSVASIFKNRVSISGAVYYAGVYSLDKMVTLKDLLVIAKPKEAAFKERAVLRRLQADYTPKLLGFNLDEALNESFNVNLRREDSVHIYPYNEIKDTFKVQERGEVNRPDSFYFAKGMQVRGAVLMAGGYKDGASEKAN